MLADDVGSQAACCKEGAEQVAVGAMIRHLEPRLLSSRWCPAGQRAPHLQRHFRPVVASGRMASNFFGTDANEHHFSYLYKKPRWERLPTGLPGQGERPQSMMMSLTMFANPSSTLTSSMSSSPSWTRYQTRRSHSKAPS